MYIVHAYEFVFKKIRLLFHEHIIIFGMVRRENVFRRYKNVLNVRSIIMINERFCAAAAAAAVAVVGVVVEVLVVR